MASIFKTVTLEELTELNEAAENLDAQKNTINWVMVFNRWCDENSLEKNLEMILIEQLDKVLERFYVSACKQDGTDLSPMIIKGNQMVFSYSSPFDYNTYYSVNRIVQYLNKHCDRSTLVNLHNLCKEFN